MYTAITAHNLVNYLFGSITVQFGLMFAIKITGSKKLFLTDIFNHL